MGTKSLPPRDTTSVSEHHAMIFQAWRCVIGDLPVIVRCGGSAIGHLTGAVRPSLAQRRNTLAHGDPFEGLSTGGLLELVRDLINFAYRHYLAEAESLSIAEGSDLTLTNTPAMADAQ